MWADTEEELTAGILGLFAEGQRLVDQQVTEHKRLADVREKSREASAVFYSRNHVAINRKVTAAKTLRACLKIRERLLAGERPPMLKWAANWIAVAQQLGIPLEVRRQPCKDCGSLERDRHGGHCSDCRRTYQREWMRRQANDRRRAAGAIECPLAAGPRPGAVDRAAGGRSTAVHRSAGGDSGAETVGG